MGSGQKPKPKPPFVERTDLLANGAYSARMYGKDDVGLIVLHQTASGSVTSAQAIRDYFNSLKSPHRVSAHYVVGKEAPRVVILQCVPDGMEAWHAGEPSSWHGRPHVNRFSIGIEIVDDADGRASDSWPDRQVQAVAYLLRVLFKRHGLGWAQVTDHKHVLRTGERNDMTRDFDWDKLRRYVKKPPWK